MLCGAPLGKSPIFPPPFSDLAIDERFEAVFSPTAAEIMKRVPVHCFYILDIVLISTYKHFVLSSLGGCAAG